MNTFHSTLRNLSLGITLSAAFVPALWTAPVEAFNLSGRAMSDFTAFPVTSIESVTPKVMLTMSRGKVVVAGTKFVGQAGHGKFLKRGELQTSARAW